jgi:diguanylate cyclase (GGDEF)-like protein
VHDADGRVVQYIGVQSDVTDRVRTERALREERDRSRSHLAAIERLAWTDPLTGLPNRRRLAEQVELAVWDARATDGAVALLFCDLDGFKAVNDGLGHAAGDELLVAVAARLSRRLRRGDLLARLGGDEFLVALSGLEPATARREAERVAAGLAAALADPVPVAGTEVRVGASIGVGVFPDDAADLDGLLRAADRRMYERKHAVRA